MGIEHANRAANKGFICWRRLGWGASSRNNCRLKGMWSARKKLLCFTHNVACSCWHILRSQHAMCASWRTWCIHSLMSTLAIFIEWVTFCYFNFCYWVAFFHFIFWVCPFNFLLYIFSSLLLQNQNWEERKGHQVQALVARSVSNLSTNLQQRVSVCVIQILGQVSSTDTTL